MSGAPGPKNFRHPTPAGRPLRAAVLATVAIVGLATWMVGIRHFAYDHDEVARAHAAWLSAQGRVPYRDFLDWHPPYTPLLAPVVGKGPIDPAQVLGRLRWLSLAGNLLFLAGAAALGSAGLAETDEGAAGRSWGLLGLMVIALHPTILPFLVEFRIDGWGHALTAWSLYRFVGRPGAAARAFELGLACGMAALLLSPKLALLPPLVVLFDLAGLQGARETIRARLRTAGGYLAGTLAAIGLFVAYLQIEGIRLDEAYRMVVVYNAIHNGNAGYSTRLRHSLIGDGLLFGLVVVAVAAWALERARGRAGPRTRHYLPALLAWMMIQAAVVSYPFKQYYAPWFLLASAFLYPVGQSVGRRANALMAGVFLAVAAAVASGDIQLARAWLRADEAGTQQADLRWMNRVSLPGDHVVASAPLHPIDRLDTFSLWFNTADPSGFDGEKVLERIPSLRGLVSPESFRRELEENPPAFVVISGDWRMAPRTAGQQAALAEYFRRHPYHAVRRGGSWLAIRPDRHARAVAEGLLRGPG